MKSWFKCEVKPGAKPEDGEVCEMSIYDEIGGWGISAKHFIAEIKNSKAKTVHMRINSPGGSVFEGLAIYNFLKSVKDKTITCQIDGVAASMASIVALAASKISMPTNAYMMIHQPFSGFADGANAGEMRKQADLLDQFAGSLANIYSARSGKTPEECLALMEAETWMDGKTAKEMGFADEVIGEVEMAACVDGLRYAKTPEALKFKALAEVTTPPENVEAPPVVPVVEPAASEEQTAFVPPDMGQLLNSQVGNELYAAYRYFALSAACQAKGLEGFAGRLMEQGNGEIVHMMKVYSYLVSTGANMVLPAIEAPVVDSSMDMLSMTRTILDQEMSVTAEWSAISKLAKAQDNAATQKLAQEFMAEQIEEENTALTLHQRVKLADSGSGILTIDADLKGAAVTAIESFKAKVRNDLIAEVTPAIKAELEIKAQAEANDKLDQRKQVRLMIDSFGKTRGADYFDKGMNFEQAMRADRESLKAELGKAKAENAELATKLQIALKNPAVPFEANSESQGSARVSQSDFDAYCKDRQITGAKKESLWKSMCEVKKQAKKEEEND